MLACKHVGLFQFNIRVSAIAAGEELICALDPAPGQIGGLYPNLVDAHPPFQIDGNFGAAAGIVEYAPAEPRGRDPPAARAAERVAGRSRTRRARGGFDVDIEWDGGRLVQATLVSRRGSPLRVRYGDRVTAYSERVVVRS